MALTESRREEIINDVNDTWSALMDKLSSFREDEYTVPNVIGIWSLKDLVGHLETWDRIAIEKISAAESGSRGSWRQHDPDEFRSLDEFNEAMADRKRDRALSQLWSELDETHRELLERLQVTPVLSRDLIREDTYKHYREHLADIEAWENGR